MGRMGHLVYVIVNINQKRTNECYGVLMLIEMCAIDSEYAMEIHEE